MDPLQDSAPEGLRVLVTGASSGIGRAAAVALGKAGYQVICHGRDSGRLAETLALMPGQNGCAETFELEEVDSVESWAQSLIKKYGPIHGYVHAAGIQQTMPLPVVKSNTIERMFRINVESSLLITKILSRQREMSQSEGSIVLVSSVMGQVGLPGYSLYSMCKGAISAMVRSLALELAPKRIRVNAIAPGCVQTPMLDQMLSKLDETQVSDLIKRHPLGLGTVDDVIGCITYLLSGQSKWITGTTITLDGGYTAQ